VLLTLDIRDVVPATPRARIVRLDLGTQRFDYAAGQAVLVGSPGRPRRPYSVAASSEDARRDRCLELLVGVDISGAPGPHLSLAVGQRVEAEGPLGTFTFPDAPMERRFIFIAGGTGIAPLRAMLHHALTLPQPKIGLFYSARTPEEFAYQAEFRALADEGRIELRQTVTRALGDAWSGARGRFGRTALAPLVHDPATLCFVCGPPAFVGEMSTIVGELGIVRERIRVEEWG
jgi:ferredoxin-NADP reductase